MVFGGLGRLKWYYTKKKEGLGGMVVCPHINKHNNFLFIGVVVPCCYHQKVKKTGPQREK